MQSGHPELWSGQGDSILTLEVGTRGSTVTVLRMTVGHLTPLWFMSLQSHSASLSLMCGITTESGPITQCHPHCLECPIIPSLPCISWLVFESSHPPPTESPLTFLAHHFPCAACPQGAHYQRLPYEWKCPPRLQMNIFSTVYFPSLPNNSYGHTESKCPIFFDQVHKVDFTGIDF